MQVFEIHLLINLGLLMIHPTQIIIMLTFLPKIGMFLNKFQCLLLLVFIKLVHMKEWGGGIQPGSSIDKRIASIRIIELVEGYQSKNICIIFHGAGKLISEKEKLAYHPTVKVYWQKKACNNMKFNVYWAETHVADISG